MDTQARRAKLADFDFVDAIALVPGANMAYFTGLHMHLSERPTIALISGDEIAFIVPELETPVIKQHSELEGRLFVWTDSDGFEGAFREAAEALGLNDKRLGVDDLTMRTFELLAFLDAAPDMQVKPISRDLLDIRAIKEPGEIEAMRRAIAITEIALDTLLTEIQVGMTEREIANRLDALLTEGGSQDFAFKALVQTGPNSALPHGGVTDRALQADEFLLIDFGGKYGGYPADITRTFCLGTPTDEMQRIHDTVRRANEAAIAVVKPGIACGDVDKAARDVISEAGYGEYFIHRTGHGLGLETHERPQIAEGVEDLLQPGTVFTIEPGIYVPGLGGVRIEDDVLVTDDGVEVLTTFRKDMVIHSS